MPFDIHAKDGAIQEQIVEGEKKKRVGFQGGMMCIIGRHGLTMYVLVTVKSRMS